MPTSTTIGRALAAVALACATLAVTGGPSGATTALSCKGATCVGKDPAAYGCDDDAERMDIASSDNWSKSVRLMRSAKCSAYWAVGVDQSSCCGYTVVKAVRQIKTTYGWYNQRVQTVDHSNGAGTRWTPMNQNTSGDRHQACYYVCTSWKS
ncbi:DUF2690 domain-containing protein [Streptosporangium sp. NPDC006013]|uniref:DUF2690 domain-containing protein n=1 Tax=Streptosporangium sp. NPDC006013 TaxID=3155596 RepID=UPI0033B1BA25